MEFINDFFNIHSGISFLIGFIVNSLFVYKLVSFFIHKEIRLFKNLKRTIYLMTTSNQGQLQREKSLLQKNGLYHVYDEIISLSDLGTLDTVEKFSIFVISYSKEFTHYQEIIDRAKRDVIPVIFLTSPKDITDEQMAIFKEYPYFDMCNTSARLLTTIFNLSAVTPDEKR